MSAAHNNLGNILRDVGRCDESADCYRAAIRLEPTFTDAWVNLSWVLALTGHARQAEEAARQRHRLRRQQMPMRTTISVWR